MPDPAEALRWRYAVKKFDPLFTLGEDQVKVVTDAAWLAPTSFGLQPYRVVVIPRGETSAKFPAFSWGQRQPADASHLLVFAYRSELTAADVDQYLTYVVVTRGVTAESLSGYRAQMVGTVQQMASADKVAQWTKAQTYIAVGFALQAAALHGIDACPMEGFDGGKCDELLGLGATPFRSCCLLPIGRRAADDKYQHLAKVRRPEAEVIDRRPA